MRAVGVGLVDRGEEDEVRVAPDVDLKPGERLGEGGEEAIVANGCCFRDWSIVYEQASQRYVNLYVLVA